jgi:hypothetical protein
MNTELFFRTPNGKCVVLSDSDDICVKAGWCWVKWYSLVLDTPCGDWEYRGRKLVNPFRRVRVLEGLFRGVEVPLDGPDSEIVIDRLAEEVGAPYSDPAQ